MTEPQVFLDARGATPAELVASATTLLSATDRLEVVHADEDQLAALRDRFGDRVVRAGRLRRTSPVVVCPGRVALARGAVRRMLVDLAVPGRCLTCVLVQGGARPARVACWAPRWLQDYGGTVEQLVDADLAFDREHLPPGSPAARAWLRADTVGAAPVEEVGDQPQRWARSTGRALAGRAAVARVRAPLGVTRRRLARRRQRRRLVRRTLPRP